MLADVTIDGMVEEEFRQAIETLLREGNADDAAKWLKSRLAPLCGEDLPLPTRFLAITSAEVTVTGWEDIASRLRRLDAVGSSVTAIGVDLGNLSDPGHIGLSSVSHGPMAPHIETCFYTDNAWPFSRCDRAGLLMGYQGGKSGWAGKFVEADDTIGIKGLDDLNGAVLALEQRCHSHGRASDIEQRAYMLGSSYIAVLVHLAVRDAAVRRGLPRPLAVLVGSNESYPFFDAPVIAAPDAVVSAPSIPHTPVEFGQSKIEEDPESEEALDEAELNHPSLLELRELTDPEVDPGQEPEAWDLPSLPDHVTGTQLRKRLVTPESIAELEAAKKPSLLQRLFRRN